MQIINSNSNMFWLDSLFLGKNNRIQTLEEQMNTISKLIVFSFFLLVLFFPVKVAAGCTICMLFFISLLYYYMESQIGIKEHFDVESKPNTYENRTYLDSIKTEPLVTIHNRERMIESREPILSVQHKTILPLHSYQKKIETPGNPKAYKPITPEENLFSQGNSQGKTLLEYTPNVIQRDFVMSTERPIFRRTNIDHIIDDVDNDTEDFLKYQAQIDTDYMENQMLMRDNYEQQVKTLNQLRDEHYKIAPIHTNFRVQGFGGPQFSANYLGPRGTR
jgi:hypothetical protein